MQDSERYEIKPIGFVRSELKDRRSAPRQGYEGAPDAKIDIDPAVADGLQRLEVGQEVILITWFHQTRRDTLLVTPRWAAEGEIWGVFATRSPDRPNPLGLHRVTLREIGEHELTVGPLEALDGTPVVDIKPVLQRWSDA